MEFRVSWEEDYEMRCNPVLLTSLLHESVPVLKFVDWRVIEVGEGFVKSMLPLNPQSTNQHGTHQAAVIVLSADYTGGIALGTLFRGVSIMGVHPWRSDDAAALWLSKVNMEFLAPSADHLVVTCSVPSEKFSRIRRRYFAGNRVIESLDLTFEAGGTRVASGSLVYFARQARMLRPRSTSDVPNPLFSHRVKSSARLVAGVRATEHHRTDRLYSDPYSSLAAGTHGRLLSDIFLALLPQLRDMIVARTKDLDDRLTEAIADGVQQVVFVGVGLDFRAFRLIEPRSDVRVFELDLPDMLTEREKVLSTMTPLPEVHRTTLAIDLESDDIADTLLLSGDFDLTAPTFFIYEGISMYLSEQANRDALDSIHGVMGHAMSRLWVDMVSRSAIDGVIAFPEADQFLKGMERKGEPFVFGHDQPEQFFADLGFSTVESCPSSRYSKRFDPVLEQYGFFLLENSVHPAEAGAGVEKPDMLIPHGVA
jgi:methyltransferase (TIGR00027 family)